MFDIGFWEFALIGVITLIVVGPERMPSIARAAGRYVGKAKRFIVKIQKDIGEEIEVDKLKEHLNLEDENSNIIEVLKETKNSIGDIKSDIDKKL
ncbi:MAG: twin-arginine translocase subunit TatB [Candidatus Thioglobus sp.]|nr:MAG: twin-arginine translocase subunit TatB [Candidatus Thioglobus sp.]KAA0454951.1 MAG: twin-arginine translocase subunit TatB [Candidatus Thioglobus sp.]